jgi:hypothetical protein
MKIGYQILAAVAFAQIALTLGLVLWIYLRTRGWGLAFTIAGYLEWPVKNRELQSKLTGGQIALWKASALLRTIVLAAAITILVVKLIIIFRFH